MEAVWVLVLGKGFLFGIFKLFYNNELEVRYLIFYSLQMVDFLDSKQSWFVFLLKSI